VDLPALSACKLRISKRSFAYLASGSARARAGWDRWPQRVGAEADRFEPAHEEVLMPRHVKFLFVGGAIVFVTLGMVAIRQAAPVAQAQSPTVPDAFDASINQNAQRMLEDGRKIFRYDTFGSEEFWGASCGCTKRSSARNSAMSVGREA
jgi:hypothetical protein